VYQELLGGQIVDAGDRGFSAAWSGRAVSALSECGRWRTADTSRAQCSFVAHHRRVSRAAV